MDNKLTGPIKLWMGMLTLILTVIGVLIGYQQLQLNKLLTSLERTPPEIEFSVRPVVFSLNEIGGDFYSETELKAQGHSLHNLRLYDIHVEEFEWTKEAVGWLLFEEAVITPYVKFLGPEVLDFPVAETRYIQTASKLAFKGHFVVRGVRSAYLEDGERIQIATLKLVFKWRDVVTGIGSSEQLPVSVSFERKKK